MTLLISEDGMSCAMFAWTGFHFSHFIIKTGRLGTCNVYRCLDIRCEKSHYLKAFTSRKFIKIYFDLPIFSIFIFIILYFFFDYFSSHSVYLFPVPQCLIRESIHSLNYFLQSSVGPNSVAACRFMQGSLSLMCCYHATDKLSIL